MTELDADRIVTVRSPDGANELSFHLETRGELEGYASFEPNGLTYAVVRDGNRAIRNSRLGLTFAGDPPLTHHFAVESVETSTHEENWTPVLGERSRIRDAYESVRMTVRETIPPHRSLTLVGRAYDEGIAIRYVLQDDDGAGPVTLSGETTEFTLPSGCMGYHHVGESPYDRRPIGTVGEGTGGSERPLTVVFPDGGYGAITEAANESHGRMRLRGDDADRLTTIIDGERHVSLPYETPWRVVMLGDEPGDLLAHNDIIRNLAPPCRLENTDWIQPGKVIREVTLTTEGGKRCVDFAAEHGLQYVLFDGGWYGHPYDAGTNADAASPWPWKVGTDDVVTDRLDLDAVIEYGASRGIGIWLYLDKRVLERRLEDLVPIYADWGIAGLKFGFVRVGSAGWTSWLHEAVELCAEHELLVNIHDEYRPTGLSRTYPNLLTQEGIRGNEHHPSPRHNVTLPFTRFLAGAADYTVCVREERTQPTAAHQLALPIVFYSPLQHLYWYAEPADVTGLPEIEFFADVPTTWDDTRVLEGSIGEFVTIARRSGDAWFIGSITADERTVTIPCRLLAEECEYEATIAEDDGHGGIDFRTRLVDAATDLSITLGSGGGMAATLTPIQE